MKKSNATLAALLFAFGSASTYAAPPQPKPGKNAAESVANMTELVCTEVTPIVANALALAYKGKNESQVAKYLADRVRKDEKAGNKYYATVLDADGWGKATASAVSPHAAKIMKKFPKDPETYAASVERTKTTYYEVCMRDYPAVLKSVYDDLQKNR